jgi:8-oxo-dGTP diphosphatase
MLTVVAALIERDGKVLACQRRRRDTFGLLWEFPGGKKHPGETPAQALQRELREELDVEAEVGAEIYRTHHRYSELAEPIELVFFAAAIGGQPVRNLAFESMEWRAPATLLELNFLPADRELVRMLSTGALPRMSE